MREISITSGEISATMIEVRDKWCVYQHTFFGEDKPFYIGVTKLREVFNCRDAYTNTWWTAHVVDNTEIKLKVLAICDTAAEAHNYQRQCYNRLRPIANVEGYRSTGRVMITCVEGPNKDKTYLTITEAAHKCGISQGALSNHLNGRPGYESIHGMKFVRGLGE